LVFRFDFWRWVSGTLLRLVTAPSVMRIRLRYVVDAVPTKPDGYLAAVLAAGRVDGEWVELSDDDYLELATRFPPLSTAKASSVVRSAVRWIAHGLHVAPEALQWERSCVCALCPAWDAGRRRCNECGCTSLKHWLATERCPLGRW
jgi:hypothetical protein